jgi:hypothetical protein
MKLSELKNLLNEYDANKGAFRYLLAQHDIRKLRKCYETLKQQCGDDNVTLSIRARREILSILAKSTAEPDSLSYNLIEDFKKKFRVEAVSKIGQFWRNHRGSSTPDFYSTYRRIKEATPEEIKNEKFNKLVCSSIDDCARRINKTGLQMIAHALFSGAHRPQAYSYSDKLLPPLLYILRIMFSDKYSTSYDIARILKKSFSIWRKVADAAHLQPQLPLSRLSYDEHKGFESHWTGGKDQSGDEDITISHGGGFYHILDFLRGRSVGYPLEKGGLGLQVSPNNDPKLELACGYAHNNPPSHFDTPTMFKAKIPAKYLLRAPNGYEAGLRPEVIPQLKEIEIIADDNSYGGSRFCLTDITECFMDEPRLIRNIYSSVKRVAREFSFIVLAEEEKFLAIVSERYPTLLIENNNEEKTQSGVFLGRRANRFS